VKEYCGQCGKVVIYEIESEAREIYVNLTDKIFIMADVARCGEGHEIYISELEHKNFMKAKVSYEQLKSLMD
jgi:hypothetical protein